MIPILIIWLFLVCGGTVAGIVVGMTTNITRDELIVMCVAPLVIVVVGTCTLLGWIFRAIRIKIAKIEEFNNKSKYSLQTEAYMFVGH